MVITFDHYPIIPLTYCYCYMVAHYTLNYLSWRSSNWLLLW